jgi:hypothetical protein
MRRILVFLAPMVMGVVLASGVALAAVVSEVEPNDSIPAGAQALAAASFDLTANTDITDSTGVPHATVNGSGDATADGPDNDTFDYYSFTVPAGDPVRVVLDIDHTTPDGATQYDSYIELYDSNGGFLADSDDASGDPGSTTDDPNVRDSFIQTTLNPGTYYVGVGQFYFDELTGGFFMAEVPDTATYQLHVSVGNDTTPPDTTITAGPADGSLVNPGFATFSFSADDNSTFECRLDDQVEFTTCDSPITYTGLSVGSHTFEVQATDDDGNVETESASRTWFVSDVTAPTVQSTTPLDGTTKVSRTPNITATFSEEMVLPANSFRLEKVRVQGQRVTVLGDPVATSVQNPATGQLNPNVVRLALGQNVSLDKNSYYRVTITTAATDLVGYPLQSQETWRFNTAPK